MDFKKNRIAAFAIAAGAGMAGFYALNKPDRAAASALGGVAAATAVTAVVTARRRGQENAALKKELEREQNTSNALYDQSAALAKSLAAQQDTNQKLYDYGTLWANEAAKMEERNIRLNRQLGVAADQYKALHAYCSTLADEHVAVLTENKRPSFPSVSDEVSGVTPLPGPPPSFSNKLN